MDIEGTYTLQASPEEVWQSLMDRQVLLRAVPGIERLEQLDKDTYALAIHIKHAPLIGTYHGYVTVTEQQYPYHYRLIIDGEGRQSSLSGNGVVHLNQRDNLTVIAYKGTLNLGKLGTLMPAALAKGTAKLLLQQFFTALADSLRAKITVPAGAAEEMEEIANAKPSSGDILIFPSSPVQEPAQPPVQTPLYVLVRWLGLGSGDVTQEELWAARIRRVGIVSGLLFLVWLGTRLPRK